MILYTLRCRKDHQFDAWFRDGGAYEQQVAAGEVRCPLCGSKKVEKALMAPRVTAGRGRGRSTAAAATQDSRPESGTKDDAAEVRKALRDLRRQIETNFDYVGPQFAEEARKIHYGEIEQRAIYGETSAEDAEALHEEGIAVKQVPWLPRDDA